MHVSSGSFLSWCSRPNHFCTLRLECRSRSQSVKPSWADDSLKSPEVFKHDDRQPRILFSVLKQISRKRQSPLFSSVFRVFRLFQALFISCLRPSSPEALGLQLVVATMRSLPSHLHHAAPRAKETLAHQKADFGYGSKR